ncbi:PEST, proteolytic signal-containing nuclear protein family domain-containing protein [Phthorimaea operculella]|nr:PEST, proteolytic signal-containing nuclear protein family domain-containing protein [Phthorimaea operculella]
MSNRFYEYDDTGSSRSARDDSRHKGRRDEHRSSRTRSRSPKRYSPPSSSSRSRHSPEYEKSRSRDRDYGERRHKSHRSNSGSDEEVPAPPPPPRISKITIGFSKPSAPIKMNLGGAKLGEKKALPKPTVASVFNADDDDEPEEMPAEARMRMRNIGRETPTSAGPNSFGKTKQGFCDSKKVFEKNLKQALETEQRPTLPKFPQTIYKIKPSS